MVDDRADPERFASGPALRLRECGPCRRIGEGVQATDAARPVADVEPFHLGIVEREDVVFHRLDVEQPLQLAELFRVGLGEVVRL